MQGQATSYGDCPSVINIQFTKDPKEFSTYKGDNPFSTMSTIAEVKNICPPEFEYNNPNAPRIVFNHTNVIFIW